MAIRNYIPVELDNIPELFEFDFDDGKSFLFGINYAESQDLFSVDLYSIEGEPIALGERLVLNERLWADIIDDRLPSVDLVPLDESGKETKITKDNFTKTVFLYFDDLAPEMELP
ncbi:TPA: phage baseplate plug family protein, partial [Listeria monocytogenes]